MANHENNLTIYGIFDSAGIIMVQLQSLTGFLTPRWFVTQFKLNIAKSEFD
jgi:hypothetical protein